MTDYTARRRLTEVKTDGIGIHLELEPTTRFNDETPAKELVDGDRLVLGGLRTFTVGTVIGYALRNGDDPVEAIDQARANGHELVWINANGAVLSAERRPSLGHIIIQLGDRVRLEGRVYTIAAAPNRNLKLVPAA